MSSIKIIVFFAMVIVVMIGRQPADTAELKCSDFDRLFNDLTIVSSPNRSFPTNAEEFSAYCKKGAELAAQVGQLAKNCFTDTMKNILSVSIYSYKSRNKGTCKSKNGKRARRLLDAGPCLNDNKQKLSKCIETSARRLEAFKSVQNNLKFPYMCCESVNFGKCLERVQIGECKEKLKIFSESAQSILSGFVDRSCGEYNADTDKCDSLKPVKLPIAGTDEHPSLMKNAASLVASIE